jgi:YHS domain-containing protein
MRVPTQPVGEMAVVDGVSYHFCCSGCRARFEADPARYIGGVNVQ